MLLPRRVQRAAAAHVSRSAKNTQAVVAGSTPDEVGPGSAISDVRFDAAGPIFCWIIYKRIVPRSNQSVYLKKGISTYFIHFGNDCHQSLYLGRGLAYICLSIWKGCPPIYFFCWKGWPPIYFSMREGMGIYPPFDLEGMATNLPFYKRGWAFIYLSIWRG